MYNKTNLEKASIHKPLIRKLGTIDCDLVETTPIVFKGRLYRFEYVRGNYRHNQTRNSYFRFIDIDTGQSTPSFAVGYHLGSAYVEGDMVYVYGMNVCDRSKIQVFWSRDLKNWSAKDALTIPGWRLYNNSVCRCSEQYVMAFEVGEPPEVVGVRFTIFFAESKDLLNRQPLLAECVFSRDRYTACPAIRFLDNYYYMIYLEALEGPRYESYIVRSPDFVHWEESLFNPVLKCSSEDKIIANPHLASEESERIAKAVNINNSDVDLCEFEGKTIIYYSWGDQEGNEFLEV